MELRDPHREFGGEGPPALLVVGGRTEEETVERRHALGQLCVAARQLGSVGSGVELSVHDLPRAAFDALPGAGEELPKSGAWTKRVPLGDRERITLVVYTREPPADPDVDWFEIARLITAAPADET